MADRSLKYFIRILEEGNWAKMVYSHLVENNIDTDWRVYIRKLKGEIGFNRGKKGMSKLVREWQIKSWKKDIDSKKSLKLYKRDWTGRLNTYIDGSEEAKAFFGVVTNSLVGKMWNEKRSPCPVCKAVGWDDIHALYGCVCQRMRSKWN